MPPDTKKPPAFAHADGRPNERNFCIPVATSIPQSAPKSTSKSSQRWKALERTAAKKLGGRRIVRQDFFESSPDVVVPDFGLVCEAKAYAKFSFHRHLEQAQKYCRDGEIPALVTKESGQIGEFLTLPLDYVAALLNEIRALRAAP